MAIVSSLEKYAKIYQKILQYQKQRDGVTNPKISVYSSFWWEDTDEGFKFWALIDRYEIDMARELKPEMFEPIQLEISNNGLWSSI